MSKKFVLVEAIDTFRMRYVVELNAEDPEEWACDDVVMERAGEIGQKFMGQTLLDHRVVTEDEIREMVIGDADAYQSWSTEKMIEIFVRDNRSD